MGGAGEDAKVKRNLNKLQDGSTPPWNIVFVAHLFGRKKEKKIVGLGTCLNIQKSFHITGEIESCDFEPPDGATLETLDKHWQNY